MSQYEPSAEEKLKGMITKNACSCGICGANADRWASGFQCQKNPHHLGDPNVGIFSDLTPPNVIVVDFKAGVRV